MCTFLTQKHFVKVETLYEILIYITSLSTVNKIRSEFLTYLTFTTYLSYPQYLTPFVAFLCFLLYNSHC